MVIFDSAAIFIDGATQLCDKIVRIDLIIDGLLTNALSAAENADIKEYSLNDGQTIIRKEYMGVEAVMKSIYAFEKLKQVYVNRLNGRVVRLMDGKSVNSRRHGGR